MRLKPDVDPEPLLRAVKECHDEVWFDTEHGDHLNLKTAVSQLMFAAAQTQMIARRGTLTCRDVSDYELLREYLTD